MGQHEEDVLKAEEAAKEAEKTECCGGGTCGGQISDAVNEAIEAIAAETCEKEGCTADAETCPNDPCCKDEAECSGDAETCEKDCDNTDDCCKKSE